MPIGCSAYYIIPRPWKPPTAFDMGSYINHRHHVLLTFINILNIKVFSSYNSTLLFKKTFISSNSALGFTFIIPYSIKERWQGYWIQHYWHKQTSLWNTGLQKPDIWYLNATSCVINTNQSLKWSIEQSSSNPSLSVKPYEDF